jgi:hypothetical protein
MPFCPPVLAGRKGYETSDMMFIKAESEKRKAQCLSYIEVFVNL